MDPLATVRANAGPYPRHLLEGCESGLLLCGAAFLGANDGVHFHDAGLSCTVVDKDCFRLADMWALYSDWLFVTSDMWKYARELELAIAAGIAQPFDAVSIDCWTGDMERPVLDDLELWCSLAKKFVTVTIGRTQGFVCPAGWTFSFLRRSGRSRWLILERAI